MIMEMNISANGIQTKKKDLGFIISKKMKKKKQKLIIYILANLIIILKMEKVYISK